MSGFKVWLLALALAAVPMVSPAADSPATVTEERQCVGHQEAVETLTTAMPGLAVHDVVEGADIGGLGQVVELDPETGSIIAFIHPSAWVREVGFILLVVFFDKEGCYQFDAEIPQDAFDEKVKAGRERVVS